MAHAKKTAAKKVNSKKETGAKSALKKAAAIKAVPKTATSKKIIEKKRPQAIKKRSSTKDLQKTKKAPRDIPEIMRDEALKILDDRQAEEITTINLSGKSSVADYLIIASGRSARQISAMAHYLREAFINHGIKNIRVEGVSEGNWALIDGGDVIVHLFRPEVRSYYDLESIWDKKSASNNQTAREN